MANGSIAGTVAAKVIPTMSAAKIVVAVSTLRIMSSATLATDMVDG